MSSFRPRADPWSQDPNVLYVRPSVHVLGVDFGRKEARDIALSTAALIAIFSCGLSGGIASPGFAVLFPYYLPVAVAACAPTFFTAIYLQKRVGARSACTVEFRVEPQWLGISVLFSVLMGFVFAIPGSTHRFGNLTRSTAGKMGAASVGTFLAVSGGAMAAAVFAVGLPAATAGLVLIATPWGVLVILTQITALLAMFQMFPVSGFPGLDIWRWSKGAYVGALAIGFVLFAVSRWPELIY